MRTEIEEAIKRESIGVEPGQRKSQDDVLVRIG
jgi:hypothetical protein